MSPAAALWWQPETLRAYPWLADLADVPQDASPPLAMSPPHPDAVGSYGWEAIEWIEETQRIQLRWWQRLALVMQLQHDANGSLLIREILESAPRRAGKSLKMRGLALWRMNKAELFGEVQTVLHTGNKMAACRDVQRDAWRWANAAGWRVSTANGKEAIESPDGDRWLVQAQDGAGYSYAATLALVDEAWDVKPETVTDGLEPALLERVQAQLVVTSTAHRRATSLMRNRLSAALTEPDDDTLVLLWAALAGSDPADPAVWRAASPHWSEDRARMIAAKYAAALAGQVDPEFDDPDPMAGFTSQYLNVWRFKATRREVGDPVTDADSWADLATDRPVTTPDSVAVESWYSEGVSVARAWRRDSGVLVSVTEHASTALAAAAIRETGFRGRVIVGESLADDPAFSKIRLDRKRGPLKAAVEDLSRLLTEGALEHDGSEFLSEQVLALRTSPAADGIRVRSTGRADGVKAVTWAAAAARTKPRGSAVVLLPTGT